MVVRSCVFEFVELVQGYCERRGNSSCSSEGSTLSHVVGRCQGLCGVLSNNGCGVCYS